MDRPRILLFFSALTLAMLSPELYAATLACKSGTVFVEDARADVLQKCGEPDSKNSRQEEVSERLDSSTKRKLFITIEEWTYNFGPGYFMTMVTLKNGKVAEIQDGDYGYRKVPQPAPREFSDRIVSIGDSQSEVLGKWGEPVGKNSHQEELKERRANGQRSTVFVTVDEWTYNLGPDRFMRIITFNDGRVKEIETGSYGYERK